MIIVIIVVTAKIYGEKYGRHLAECLVFNGCPMRIATFGDAFILCLTLCTLLYL